MPDPIEDLIGLMREHDGINDKGKLTNHSVERFGLIKDRSVYYCREFAIRFSSSAGPTFGNTVLSLSNLKKFDDRPFVVCVVTPARNHMFLANSTFLKKISHSSHDLRANNIRGSFNGSDIMRDFEGIANTPENLIRLFNIHAGVGFEGNLVRLVEATNNISPSGRKFEPTKLERQRILLAPGRASQFVASRDASILKTDLDDKVHAFETEILLAALIENVNVRGRIIEYLIAGEDERLRQDLVDALRDRGKAMPPFKTENTLGDYHRDFENFATETDVKTKIMVLDSNPKGYNLDKMLEFLASERSVFMFYFVGVEPARIVATALVSMFQDDLLRATILLKHWAGRNSRGVSQFEGRTIAQLILAPSIGIDEEKAKHFLEGVLAL